VIVLADSAENLADMDVAEARRLAEEAKHRADEDRDERAEAEMRVAMARVEIAESRGH
jgi:F0F1-type ATP synthase epsilon subunit